MQVFRADDIGAATAKSPTVPAGVQVDDVALEPVAGADQRRPRMTWPLTWFKTQGIKVTEERTQVDTYLSCVILAESVGSLWGNFVRDYLVEQYENMLSFRSPRNRAGGSGNDLQDFLSRARRCSRSSRRAGRLTMHTINGMLELGRAQADVVITDIVMPKSNGVDAIDAILKAFPTVRIIAISGGGNFDVTGYQQPSSITTPAYLASAKKTGAHCILTKPFESGDRRRGAGTRRWQGACLSILREPRWKGRISVRCSWAWLADRSNRSR